MDRLWDFVMEFFYTLETFPIEVIIAVFFIVGNIFIFIFLLLFLGVINVRAKFLANKVNRLSPKLEYFFNDILSKDVKYSDKQIVNKYNELIKKRSHLKYKLSMSIMLKLKKQNDYNLKAINRVFSVLRFDKFINNKTTYSNSRKKYKAINILKELEISSNSLNILPHTNSGNTNIRKEARLSYLLTNKENSYNFLETEKEEITQWDLIELMNSLEKLEKKGQLESLGKWINTSKNTSVICLLIKAIGHFKQIENKELLIRKISDENEAIRIAAVETLGILNIEEIEELLIKRYSNETLLCKKAIIKCIKTLNTGNSLSFLEETYNKTPCEEAKTSIANTIYTYNGGKGLFNKLKKFNNDSKSLIFKHVETPLIKFKEYA